MIKLEHYHDNKTWKIEIRNRSQLIDGGINFQVWPGHKKNGFYSFGVPDLSSDYYKKIVSQTAEVNVALNILKNIINEYPEYLL